ncbi:MAG: hypothetical protein R6V04_08200 [bacterium]
MKKNKSDNLLDMTPEICCKWVHDNKGTVSLIVPRFKNRLMKKIAAKLGKSEEVKIHLDEKGSNTLKLIDGTSTVEAIGEELVKDENETVEQFYQRLCEFLLILAKNRFIQFKKMK